MIFEGFGTGESSFTLERGFFFAFGAAFFAAASTRLKFVIRGSPCAIGQPCCGMAASALLTSRTSSPFTIPRRLLSKRQSFTVKSRIGVTQSRAKYNLLQVGPGMAGARHPRLGRLLRLRSQEQLLRNPRDD